MRGSSSTDDIRRRIEDLSMDVCWRRYLLRLHAGEELKMILGENLARASMYKMIVGEMTKVEIGSEK